MKYPQLVSMPSAISDWLEEQLESRGIDAIVYTRYVLSLLHRDTLDLVSTDQDIQLPKEVRLSGRGRKRFRRSTEWWTHVRADVEQLRRSAAVECLMSASDQKCGIESLVDELCEKLKHFESDISENTDLSEDQSGNKSDKSTISPSDLAKRYYAAFPPLNYTKAGSASSLITLIPQLYATTTTTTSSSSSSSSSSNKRKHGRKTTHHPHQNHRSTSRDTLLQRKSDLLDTMKSRSGGKQQRFSYFSRNKRDFGFARNMEKSVERADILSDWDLYFLNGPLNSRVGDEGYSTSDTIGVDESEDVCEIGSGRRATVADKCKSSVDDGHLAKLVAKFDRRIEALWHTDDEACVEQNAENEYHDLPVDIQELLASPITRHECAAVELLNVANRRASGKTAKPFIQCGTNITSSIWSECVDDENDKSLYDSINYCNLYNEAIEQASYPESILGDQFNSLSMSVEKLSDDIFMAAVGRPDKTGGNSGVVAENETNMMYEEHECANENNNNNNKLSLANMKLGSLRQNEFTSLPWEFAFSVGNLNNKKWSDAENYTYLGESKFTAALDNASDGGVAFARPVNRAVTESLIVLNHDKEFSLFEEVMPKKPAFGLPAAALPSVSIEQNNTADAEQPTTGTASAKQEEEEDLLTSTRTHFRPIKQETNAEATCSHGGGGAHYADGTTFAIRSSLEHVNYRRSDSGTLYLESGFDTPQKYMEYRVKDPAVPAKCDPDSESSSSIEQEFVLKFCVKQTEKYCQTEPSPALCDVSSAHSPLEVPAKKRVLCDPEEFFFPGDDELLSDSLESASSGGGSACECRCPRTRAKLATNLEPLFNASVETCSLHATRPDSMIQEINHSWNTNNNNNNSKLKNSSSISGTGTGGWKKCDKCNNNWGAGWPKASAGDDWQPRDTQSWQHIWSSNEELCRTCLGGPAGTGVPAGRSLEYFKLRDELSEDGEQLLSDLSCLQRNYMEQLPSASEMSCDLNCEPISVGVAPVLAVVSVAGATGCGTDSTKGIAISKERKRRHSSSQRPVEVVAAAMVARNSWTNASCLRLEQRCPFTPPFLRPVTL